MLSQLLGLGDIIANALGSLIMELVSPILELVCRWVLVPLIRAAVDVVMYAVGFVCYTISCLLLGLIDFVEILFRALAGLPIAEASASSGTGMSVELSLDGKAGDILLQLIRHPDIQQAFLAMCIVGVFLLVITTVFQIIKVEYTTEGAKNAKGPIMQKAFRGLANLMLLPLLVVMGIVLGNQVLGLLDKATGMSGENPTISGLIFVTAATDAHYRESDPDVKIDTNDLGAAVAKTVGISIEVIIEEVLKGLGVDPGSDEFVRSDSQRSEIEANFLSQKTGFKYYNISDVSEYFNYSKINYIVLLFGSVFVLKSLFFTCFGMVMRLYKCATLFIIAPAVIGMTPINEGGLGKWRTSFIGQVLAAYGTILSINLFFIIIRVLLSIDVSFTYLGGSETAAAVFTNSFMTGLLKCIFAIAGCLMIENMSKEIGGYFGAEDAMSAGKDMANKVGDTAMKGVVATAGVAVGGVALAKGAVKMGSGIANKMKNAKAMSTGKGAESAFKAKYDQEHGGMPEGDPDDPNAEKAKSEYAEARNLAWNNEKNARKIGRSTRKSRAYMKQYDENKSAAVNARMTDENKEILKFEEDQHNIIDEAESKIKSGKLSASERAAEQRKITEAKTSLGKRKKDISAAHRAKTDIENDFDANTPAAMKRAVDLAGDKVDSSNEFRGSMARKAMGFVAGVRGLAEDAKGNMPLNKYFKQWDGAKDKGAKALGESFVAAQNDNVYQKGKSEQDWAEKVFGKVIGAQRTEGAAKIGKQVVAQAEFTQAKLQVDANDYAASARQRMAQFKGDSEQDRMAKDSIISSFQQAMNSQGANIGYEESRRLLEMKGEITLSDLNIDFDPKVIEKAINDAMRKGASSPDELRKVITEELQKALGNTGNDGMLKIIADLFEKEIANFKS